MQPTTSTTGYRQLFAVFFRIGAFTIGGGYAMIPLIRKEVVEAKRWMTDTEFIDMLAMAQSAPGVLAINTAIFVGYKLRGTKGSFATALGCALPSFLIILLIAAVFGGFRDNPAVERIFKGIRPAVVALIAAPIYTMGKAAGIGARTLLIPVGAALLIWLAGIPPVWVVAAAVVGGLAYGLVMHHKLKKK